MHSAETRWGSPVGPSRARRYFAVALLMLAFALYTGHGGGVVGCALDHR